MMAKTDLTYDAETETYRTTCPRTWDVCTCIVMAIEEIEDDPDLDPLNTVINVDALNTLFEPRYDDQPRRGGELTFYFHGYEICVHDHGTVTLSPPDESIESF
jgi:hypothetical protein